MAVNQLTPRELTILQHLARGLTARAIARSLAISPQTVNKHLQSIYRKLRVGDRLTAVLAAQRLGLVHPSAESDGG